MILTHRIETILRDAPDTRSSDKHLFLVFMRTQGIFLTPDQQKRFLDMPSLESVRRVRQKIQEQGKYQATKQVKTHRTHKSMVIQQNAPTAKPERLATLFDDAPYRSWQ